LDTACLRSSAGNGVADPPVFPATGNAIGCSTTDSLRPLNGNLFWIDSGYDCSALPRWQKPVCMAMQRYGGYIHATKGGTDAALYVMPMEGGMNFSLLGLADPYLSSWIVANAGNLTYDSQNGTYNGGPWVDGKPGIKIVKASAAAATKVLYYFFQMPGLITGNHLHIVDPCVPKAMAGVSGGCS